MRTFVQRGETLTLVAPYAVAAGAGLQVGVQFGVASSPAALGEPVEAVNKGVFTLAKVSAQAWTQGAAIYWDNVAKLTTTVASGNLPIGTAAEAAANPSSTGTVKLADGPAGRAGPAVVTTTVSLTNGDSGHIVIPVPGTVARIDSVLLGGAVATNDAIVTAKIGSAGAGVAVTNGVITVTASGSAIGDKDTCSPTAANVIAAGDLVYFTVSGTPGGSRTATVTILVNP